MAVLATMDDGADRNEPPRAALLEAVTLVREKATLAMLDDRPSSRSTPPPLPGRTQHHTRTHTDWSVPAPAAPHDAAASPDGQLPAKVGALSTFKRGNTHCYTALHKFDCARTTTADIVVGGNQSGDENAD